MKTQMLIIVFFVFVINIVKAQTSINSDTVCAGSTEEYKIESPDANATYTWGIYKGGGVIKTTNNSNITIEWSNKAGTDSLWVFETNKSGCRSDTATLIVVRIEAPTAQFNDQTLCYGEELQLVFTGTPPFTVEYTLNGNKTTLNNIKDNPYILSGEAGEYVLLKVSSSECAGSLVSGGITKATISKPLKKLRIIRSN